MPVVSKKQRVAAAIAEHNPKELYSRNKGMLKMSKEELHKYASTKGSLGERAKTLKKLRGE